MKTRKTYLMSGLVLVSLFCTNSTSWISAVRAQDADIDALDDEPAPAGTAKGKEEKKEVVKTGLIAGTIKTKNSRNIAFDNQANDAAPGDDASVIGGSVSRAGKTQCVAHVTNSSPKNSYSVSFVVEGADKDGATAISKSFSATIPPQGTVERNMDCQPGLNMTVRLRSAKKR